MNARAEAIARAIGTRRARAAARTLAGRIAETVPGVTAAADERGVTIAGRGLIRRAIRDPRLRWLGGLLR